MTKWVQIAAAAMLLVVLAGAAPTSRAEEAPRLNVTPTPAMVTRRPGAFRLTVETRIVAADPEARRIAGLLSDALLDQHGVRLPVVARAPRGASKIVFAPAADRRLGAEGYHLEIDAHAIRISGGPAGQFYGVQTLLQLLPAQNAPAYELPALAIEDTPRFGYRGVLLDSARHYFSAAFIKRFIDLAAQYKINRFHWHLTDDNAWRLEIKRYPKLTQFAPVEDGGAGYYTQAQVREIIAYASARFVTIVPEIEMPGHSGAARAAYPELACAPAERAVAFCPKEETFAFLENVLAEVIELFPGEYIHIGGDEVDKTGWRESAEAQAIRRRERLADEDALQSHFVRRIGAFVHATGKRMIGWDEILQGGLAPNAIVMSWRGESGGVAAARQGHAAIMAPTDYTYFDYYQGEARREPLAIGGFVPLEKAYSYEPMPAGLSAEEQARIMGAQANLWTEYIGTPEHAEYMTFPRILAFSEAVWSPAQARSFGDFKRRLPAQLARLAKQDVRFRIPEPAGLADFYTTTQDHAVVALRSFAPSSEIIYTLDGADPTDASPVYGAPIRIDMAPERPVRLNVIVRTPEGRRSAVYGATFLRRPLLNGVRVANARSGLNFSVFDRAFANVRDIDRATPATRGVAATPVLDQFARTTNYAVAFDGYIKVDADDFYQFALESDDGSLLEIDGETVVDNDGYHGPQLVIGHIPLRSGFHRLKLSYFQAEGGAVLNVRWARAGKPLEELTSAALYH